MIKTFKILALLILAVPAITAMAFFLIKIAFNAFFLACFMITSMVILGLILEITKGEAK